MSDFLLDKSVERWDQMDETQRQATSVFARLFSEGWETGYRVGLEDGRTETTEPR